MSLSTPLTAGQYTKQRSGSYAGEYLLTLCKNTVVLHGQLSAPTTGLASWAFINYTAIAGSYTDVEPNMAILFSDTDDLTTAQRSRGRCRLDYTFNQVATATTIYVNESSADWPSGTYFWILYTFDIRQRMSYINSLDESESYDWNWPYQGERAMAPTLRMAYVDDVDPATGKLRLALDVSDAYSAESGRTITGYAWTFKAGTDTVISGSKSTAIVTVDLTAGEQWGKLVMTDSAGKAWTRRFYIHAHDANNPYDVDFSGLTLQATIQLGWTASAPAFGGVDDVLVNTFGVVTRRKEIYGGVSGGLSANNNVAFVGWLQREDDTLTPDPQASVLSDASFQLIGVGPALARLRGQQIGLTIPGSGQPAREVVNGTPWRAIAHYLTHYTNALDLVALDFDDTSADLLYPAIPLDASNPLDQVRLAGKYYNADIAFAPDGRARVEIDAGHLSAVQRAALPVVANYTAADCFPVSLALDPNPQNGICDADGKYYDPVLGTVDGFLVRAPGMAMGEGQGQITLSGQILNSTSDRTAAYNQLVQRANGELSMSNMNEVLTVKFTDGHTELIPSRGQLVTFTLDTTLADTNGVHRILYDTTIAWLCESVTVQVLGNGAVDVTGSFRRLSPIGDSTGLDMTPTDSGTEPMPEPDFQVPAFDWEFPELVYPDDTTALDLPPATPDPVGKIARFDGSEMVVHSATTCYYLRRIINPPNAPRSSAPLARAVTPGDLSTYLIKAVAVDPFYTAAALPAYLLASDGTNSAVWDTASVAVPAPIWAKGADIASVYAVLRAGATADTVLTYSPNIAGGGSTTLTDDLTSGLGPQTHLTSATYPFAIYEPALASTYQATGGRTGGGCIQGTNTASVHGSGIKNVATVVIDLGAVCTVTAASFWHKFSVNGQPAFRGVQCWDAAKNFIGYGGFNTNNSSTSWIQFNGSTPINGVRYVSFFTETNATTGPGYIDDLSVTYQTATGAEVTVSSDRGVTWSAPVSVGSTPGAVGGFDVQRSGTVSYAAAAGAVCKATTLGGAYSSWYSVPSSANPVCLVLPYFRRNSTTKITAASDPDVIAACDNGKLYWIDGTAATATDITPTGVTAFDQANCVTVSYGHHLAVFGKVGSTYHLFTSTNGGTSWTDRGARTAPTWIRCRRNDNRASASGTNKGQLFLLDSNLYYSSVWAATGPYIRALPSTMLGGDTVY